MNEGYVEYCFLALVFGGKIPHVEGFDNGELTFVWISLFPVYQENTTLDSKLSIN